MFIVTRKTKRYRKPAIQALYEKIYRLSILVYSNNKAYCIVTNETEREAKKCCNESFNWETFNFAFRVNILPIAIISYFAFT